MIEIASGATVATRGRTMGGSDRASSAVDHANPGPPILRIFRARVREGAEATWNQMLDAQIERDLGLGARPGLISWYRCHRLDAADSREYLVVTIWATRHHERLFAGASAHPVLPAGADQILEETTAIEYELDDQSSNH
jgi:heme-degrading monooxygenase HmoA